MKNETIDKIIPVGQRCIVEVEKVKEETSGGIVLPENTLKRDQECVCEGILINYGPTAFLDMITEEDRRMPKKGAYVYFVKYAGKPMDIGDKEYRMMNDGDIFAFGGE